MVSYDDSSEEPSGLDFDDYKFGDLDDMHPTGSSQHENIVEEMEMEM